MKRFPWKEGLVALIVLLGMQACSSTLKDTQPDTVPDWDGPSAWAFKTPAPPAGHGDPLTYRQYRADRCWWCSSQLHLEVHHIIPRRMWRDSTWTRRPEYGMNDPENLVTLCRRCHFVVGHRCNWQTGAVTNFWRMLEEADK